MEDQLEQRIAELAAMSRRAPCPKCSGDGHLSKYAHVDHGVCWDCRGTGLLVPVLTSSDGE